MRLAVFAVFGALLACGGGEAAQRPPPGTALPPQQAPIPPEPSFAEFEKSKCEGGDGQTCWSLGYGHETGKSDEHGYYPQNYAIAAQYYKRGCALGAPIACDSYARLLRDGKGVARDERSAAALFIATCERQYDWSCISAGYAYWGGKGVQIDAERAQEYFQKACSAGNAAGCSALMDFLAATQGTGKDATVPPPSGAAGFRFGTTLQEAAATCSQAGFDWLVAVTNPNKGKCTGVPAKVGLDVAFIEACASGKVCDIFFLQTLDPANPTQWVTEFLAKEKALEAHYGKPSVRRHTLPKNCYSNLADCIENTRAALDVGWTWGAGEHVFLSVNVTKGVPRLVLSYATAESTRSNVDSL